MLYREASVADIPQIQVVRHLVKENRLSDPSLVPDEDVEDYITRRGKGWVCEMNGSIVGFAIADLEDHSIWALFLDPEAEGKGIGRELHRLMLDWYFSQTDTTCWLTTAPGTRAERFYSKAGWTDKGMQKKERRFEITKDEWASHRKD